MRHTYNLSTNTKTGGSSVQGQPGSNSKLKANLGHRDTLSKTTKGYAYSLVVQFSPSMQKIQPQHCIKKELGGSGKSLKVTELQVSLVHVT